MEKLLDTLRAIEKVDYIEPKRYLTDGKPNELVKEPVKLANAVLITDGGKPNFDNINLIRENGFDVYPGEKDSFGRLTG